MNSNLRLPLPPHLHRGVDAEQAALAHLQSNGLRLIARNYRCTGGELDLVMLERQELVFVEVRYRRSEQFGGAVPSVDADKQQKLRLAAETFLQNHPRQPYATCRFDVVAISGDAPKYRIDWIRDAFS